MKPPTKFQLMRAGRARAAASRFVPEHPSSVVAGLMSGKYHIQPDHEPATTPSGEWVRMRLFDAPQGAHFKYINHPGRTYVLLSYADCGLCADLIRPDAQGRPFQGMYSVAESRAEFEAMEADVWVSNYGENQ